MPGATLFTTVKDSAVSTWPQRMFSEAIAENFLLTQPQCDQAQVSCAAQVLIVSYELHAGSARA